MNGFFSNREDSASLFCLAYLGRNGPTQSQMVFYSSEQTYRQGEQMFARCSCQAFLQNGLEAFFAVRGYPLQ